MTELRDAPVSVGGARRSRGAAQHRSLRERVRQGASTGDAALTILTIYLVLLLAIPTRLVVGPAGTPASLFGLVALLYWASMRILARPRTGPPWLGLGYAAAGFLAATLASYTVGMTRDISADEVRAADRGLLFALSSLGVILLAADGIITRERLERLLGRLVTWVTVIAVVGIVQFFTGFDVAKHITIPGLSTADPVASVLARDEFNRPAATATHPIEFSVVLAIVFPLALWRAMNAPRDRRLRRWLAVIAIAVALPMTVSRSGVLGVFVAGLVMIPTWPARRVRRTFVVVPAFLVIMRLLVPGLLGTLRNLFTQIGSDSSTLSRTNAYSTAGHYFTHSPLFGRGLGTFLPKNYLIFDNQYVLSLVDIGLVGLIAVLVLFGSGVVAARRARRLSADPLVRELGVNLTAAVAAGAVAFATFDAFSFPMCSGMMFLVIGCCGGLHRSQLGPWVDPLRRSTRPAAIRRRSASTAAGRASRDRGAGVPG